MDWDHLQKFCPFNMWVVICKERLSIEPSGGTWEFQALICFEGSPNTQSLETPDIANIVH